MRISDWSSDVCSSDLDRLAPEHLQLAVDAAEADALFGQGRHAGSVFPGRQTPEAIGDYVAGPNHVLPTADVDRAKAEIEAVIGIDASDAVAVSAKTGLNVEEVLEAIVTRIPPPKPRDTDKLQALIIDSWFDNYLG